MPPGGPAAVPGGPAAWASEEAYNCGIVNNDADLGGFWSRRGDKFRRCWTDMSGAVPAAPAASGAVPERPLLRRFISPVTNPFYFEDPRALTELRPIFIWQRTPRREPDLRRRRQLLRDLQGRRRLHRPHLARRQRARLGLDQPRATSRGIDDGNGFSEVHLGPKFTFIRNDTTSTVAAVGVIFEIPVGSPGRVPEHRQPVADPYFSIAQNFWRTDTASFNFMNTTGYSLGIDSQRTDFFYSRSTSTYDVGNRHKFYPLIEINWTHYTSNGTARRSTSKAATCSTSAPTASPATTT